MALVAKNPRQSYSFSLCVQHLSGERVMPLAGNHRQCVPLVLGSVGREAVVLVPYALRMYYLELAVLIVRALCITE